MVIRSSRLMDCNYGTVDSVEAPEMQGDDFHPSPSRQSKGFVLIAGMLCVAVVLTIGISNQTAPAPPPSTDPVPPQQSQPDHPQGIKLEIGSQASRVTAYQWDAQTQSFAKGRLFEAHIGTHHFLAALSKPLQQAPTAAPSIASTPSTAATSSASVKVVVDTGSATADSVPPSGASPSPSPSPLPPPPQPCSSTNSSSANCTAAEEQQMQERVKQLLLPFLRKVWQAQNASVQAYGEAQVQGKQFGELAKETQEAIRGGVQDALKEAGFIPQSSKLSIGTMKMLEDPALKRARKENRAAHRRTRTSAESSETRSSASRHGHHHTATDKSLREVSPSAADAATAPSYVRSSTPWAKVKAVLKAVFAPWTVKQSQNGASSTKPTVAAVSGEDPTVAPQTQGPSQDSEAEEAEARLKAKQIIAEGERRAQQIVQAGEQKANEILRKAQEEVQSLQSQGATPANGSPPVAPVKLASQPAGRTVAAAGEAVEGKLPRRAPRVSHEVPSRMTPQGLDLGPKEARQP
eukprot:RCo000826